MSWGIGCRHGLDLMLLWLWCRPAAIALRTLVWEPRYATSAALKRPKKKEKKTIGNDFFYYINNFMGNIHYVKCMKLYSSSSP